MQRRDLKVQLHTKTCFDIMQYLITTISINKSSFGEESKSNKNKDKDCSSSVPQKLEFNMQEYIQFENVDKNEFSSEFQSSINSRRIPYFDHNKNHLAHICK